MIKVESLPQTARELTSGTQGDAYEMRNRWLRELERAQLELLASLQDAQSAAQWRGESDHPRTDPVPPRGVSPSSTSQDKSPDNPARTGGHAILENGPDAIVSLRVLASARPPAEVEAAPTLTRSMIRASESAKSELLAANALGGQADVPKQDMVAHQCLVAEAMDRGLTPEPATSAAKLGSFANAASAGWADRLPTMAFAEGRMQRPAGDSAAFATGAAAGRSVVSGQRVGEPAFEVHVADAAAMVADPIPATSDTTPRLGSTSAATFSRELPQPVPTLLANTPMRIAAPSAEALEEAPGPTDVDEFLPDSAAELCDRNMHMTVNAGEAKVWIRDFGLTNWQAAAVAYRIAAELASNGVRLQEAKVNGGIVFRAPHIHDEDLAGASAADTNVIEGFERDHQYKNYSLGKTNGS